jgi:hypothetical protein
VVSQASTSRGLSRPPPTTEDDWDPKKGKLQSPLQSSLSFKVAVILGNKSTTNQASKRDISNNQNQKDLVKVNPRVTQVELELQLNLKIGPFGNWEVS